MVDKTIVGFTSTIMFCDDVTTEMVEHKIRLLTSALSHISHVDNMAEDHTVISPH